MSNWISVDERLPEVDMNAPAYARCACVIGYHAGCSRAQEMRYESNGYAKTDKGRALRWVVNGRITYTPTHWQPLPDPPSTTK
jgi:hypothetical protein